MNIVTMNNIIYNQLFGPNNNQIGSSLVVRLTGHLYEKNNFFETVSNNIVMSVSEIR